MITLTKNNINKELKGKIIVDFWASWCQPCKVMSPMFEELSKEIKNLKFAQINVDESPDLASQFGVMSIPTFILFKDEKEIERFVGSMPKAIFKSKIQDILKKI